MRPGDEPKVYQRAGWIVLFSLAILFTIGSVTYLFQVTPAVFESDTGVAWSDFSSDYPTVATYLTLFARLASVGYAGTFVFTAALTFFGFRRGVRWAWYTLWIVPAILLLTAAALFTYGQAGIGPYYVVLAIVTVVALLLPVRLFLPGGQPEDRESCRRPLDARIGESRRC